MSDDRKLRERLRDLSADGLAGPSGRPIRGPDRAALLARVLAEFDRTIMPRLIRLTAPEGQFVVVEVANRRLGRITAGGGAPALGALTGTEFTADPGEASDALRAMFEALVSGARILTLRTEPLDHQLDPDRAGLSARRLAELLDLPPAATVPDEPGDVIDAFLSRVGEAATAWLIISDGEMDGAGDQDALEAIEAEAPGLPPPGEGDAVLTALAGPDRAHGFTVAADAGGLRLVLAVPEGRLSAVADAWRDLTRPPPTLTGQ